MIIDDIKKTIVDLRREKPLILSLTNFVTMNFVTNCLLAVGAAPIISVCEDELEELVYLSSSININIGTLNCDFVNLSKKTVDFAKKYNKCLVLDPVGAGATKIRTETAKYLASNATIIKGNASEILAITGKSNFTKGVESVHVPQDAKESAMSFAMENSCIIIVSGDIDFITDGTRVSEVDHGSDFMQSVTGMGCALGAITAAFTAVIDDPFIASVLSTYYFCLCGEITAFNNKHPGSFRCGFIDQLHISDFAAMSDLL